MPDSLPARTQTVYIRRVAGGQNVDSLIWFADAQPRPSGSWQNRCLTLHVNESPEQTAAIQARQRARYTMAGIAEELQRERLQQLHQNAQRLLQPYRVVIPWAERLTFRADQVQLRRDHQKYLGLIAAVTLLHQYQREHVLDAAERPCLLATLSDLQWAHRLAQAALGQTLRDLLPQTRQLLVLLDDYVSRRCQSEQLPRLQLRFQQRELREALGWGKNPDGLHPAGRWRAERRQSNLVCWRSTSTVWLLAVDRLALAVLPLPSRVAEASPGSGDGDEETALPARL